jgi:hypothetical protein
MVSKNVLVLEFIAATAISIALLAPYEIVSSITLDENHPNLSQYDYEEDEFTGDAVQPLNSYIFSIS